MVRIARDFFLLSCLLSFSFPLWSQGYSSSRATKLVAGEGKDGANPATKFDSPKVQWGSVLKQSSMFLFMQHGLRLTQSKTREELDFPWFDEGYRRSLSGINGWNDGDSIFTNDVAHPMMGAVTGFIWIQNDPGGRKLTFENSRRYWGSRLRALSWSATYSTQFEIGALSEATLGHVGKKPGTNGLSDFFVTPSGGFALIVLEDWLDRRIVQPVESGSGPGRRRFLRMAFNPTRAFANVLRFKKPWFRDNRPLMDDRDQKTITAREPIE